MGLVSSEDLLGNFLAAIPRTPRGSVVVRGKAVEVRGVTDRERQRAAEAFPVPRVPWNIPPGKGSGERAEDRSDPEYLAAVRAWNANARATLALFALNMAPELATDAKLREEAARLREFFSAEELDAVVGAAERLTAAKALEAAAEKN